VCFKSVTSILPVLRCFAGICFGGPTFPEKKTVGRFVVSSLNRWATVFWEGRGFSQSKRRKFAIGGDRVEDAVVRGDSSSAASWNTEEMGIGLVDVSSVEGKVLQRTT